jgi:hypothetical protein
MRRNVMQRRLRHGNSLTTPLLQPGPNPGLVMRVNSATKRPSNPINRDTHERNESADEVDFVEIRLSIHTHVL